MTDSPRAAATAVRRTQILDAALQCFSEKGIESTTIDDIHRRAKASIGSIYHHFGDKEQLIAALFTSAIEEYTEGFLGALVSSRRPKSGLEHASRFHLEWFDEHPVLADLMFRTLYSDPGSPDQMRRHFVAFGVRLNEWLETHRARGELRSLHPDVYAAAIFGPCLELSRYRMGGYSSQDRDEAARQLATVMWQGLRSVKRASTGAQ